MGLEIGWARLNNWSVDVKRAWLRVLTRFRFTNRSRNLLQVLLWTFLGFCVPGSGQTVSTGAL